MTAVYDVFAQPVPVLGFALCRLLLGLVLVVDGLRMLADHDRWYGPDAMRPRPRRPLPRVLDLFAWLPSRWVLRLTVLSALAFALGVAPKIAGTVLLLTLIAIPPRNLFIVYGGDAFARTLVLLLLFAPCDAALNLGRGELGLDAVAAPWGRPPCAVRDRAPVSVQLLLQGGRPRVEDPHRAVRSAPEPQLRPA